MSAFFAFHIANVKKALVTTSNRKASNDQSLAADQPVDSAEQQF
jgi:hypothetical protein